MAYEKGLRPQFGGGEVPPGEVQGSPVGGGLATPGGRRPQKQKGGFRRSTRRTMLAFSLPALALLLLISLYPLIYASIQSLHQGDLVSVGEFVGLRNYTTVLSDPAFWRSVRFTAVFTAVGVFGSWFIGLGLALLLRRKVPGGAVLKTLLLLPWVVPIVVSTTAWNYILATPQSPLPMLAEALGFPNTLFLADPRLAQIAVCLFKVWVSFPFMMLMMSSALAGVDESVYEAAKIDGAGRWKTLRLITLPLIARPTFISWILMLIFCVNDFPTVYLLTQGGPVNSTATLIVLAYTTVFVNFQPGPGVAIAFLMTLSLIVISVALFRQIRKVDH